MAQVQLQWQRGNQQKGERGEQREPVGWLYRLHLEDTLERGQNKGSCHQASQVRVEHNEYAPLQLHFVRIHEPFDTGMHEVSLSDSLSDCAIQAAIEQFGAG